MSPYSLALVTGATSGIGKELCYLLAEKKINLIATGRNKDHLNELKNELSSKINVITLEANLLKKEERQRIVQAVHEHAPDLVINNAGFGLYGDCLTYTTQDQLNILELNGTATLELTLEEARTLQTNGRKGTIVNISSVAAFQITPGMAVYAASKAFVNQFSRALDQEMEPYGIRILAACPGMVETNFQQTASGGESRTPNHYGVMSATYVANEIWQQIERLKPLQIIDWKYALLTYFSYLFPKSWRMKIMKNNIKKRISPRNFIKIDT